MLEHGLLAGEVPPSLHGAAEPGVQRLEALLSSSDERGWLPATAFVEVEPRLRVSAAFAELALTV